MFFVKSGDIQVRFPKIGPNRHEDLGVGLFLACNMLPVRHETKLMVNNKTDDLS